MHLSSKSRLIQLESTDSIFTDCFPFFSANRKTGLMIPSHFQWEGQGCCWQLWEVESLFIVDRFLTQSPIDGPNKSLYLSVRWAIPHRTTEWPGTFCSVTASSFSTPTIHPPASCDYLPHPAKTAAVLLWLHTPWAFICLLSDKPQQNEKTCFSSIYEPDRCL